MFSIQPLIFQIFIFNISFQISSVINENLKKTPINHENLPKYLTLKVLYHQIFFFNSCNKICISNFGIYLSAFYAFCPDFLRIFVLVETSRCVAVNLCFHFITKIIVENSFCCLQIAMWTFLKLLITQKNPPVSTFPLAAICLEEK